MMNWAYSLGFYALYEQASNDVAVCSRETSSHAHGFKRDRAIGLLGLLYIFGECERSSKNPPVTAVSS